MLQLSDRWMKVLVKLGQDDTIRAMAECQTICESERRSAEINATSNSISFFFLGLTGYLLTGLYFFRCLDLADRFGYLELRPLAAFLEVKEFFLRMIIDNIGNNVINDASINRFHLESRLESPESFLELTDFLRGVLLYPKYEVRLATLEDLRDSKESLLPVLPRRVPRLSLLPLRLRLCREPRLALLLRRLRLRRVSRLAN